MNDLMPGSQRAFMNEMYPENIFEFYCATHEYGWSTDEDGKDSGCPDCEEREGHYSGCVCADCSGADLTAEND